MNQAGKGRLKYINILLLVCSSVSVCSCRQHFASAMASNFHKEGRQHVAVVVHAGTLFTQQSSKSNDIGYVHNQLTYFLVQGENRMPNLL